MGKPEPVGRLMREMVYCSHGDAVLSRVPQTSGKDRITLWCRDCRQNVAKQKGYPGMWIARDHADLVGKDLDALPIAYTSVEYRRCEGPCSKLDRCQLHHMAPRNYFGDDADSWPVAWLCESCHRVWHSLVTPGLCTAFDATRYAAFLLDTLGLDRSARLSMELNRQGKARREAA